MKVITTSQVPMGDEEVNRSVDVSSRGFLPPVANFKPEIPESAPLGRLDRAIPQGPKPKFDRGIKKNDTPKESIS
jgi:hypothetical protein